MKYLNEVSEVHKVALSMLLFSTCGEDEETLKETTVEQIADGIFHITYALDNPFEAMDFFVVIDRVRDSTGVTSHFHCTVFRSVYGDNGEFDIAIK